MAQAGIHALLGAATRKLMPKQEWLMLGVILGSLFPDVDNFAVAFATIAKLNTQSLHRTFTHSLMAVLVVTVVFLVVGLISSQRRWINLGIGLGIGISLHIVLDLLIWFNGAELLWPFGGWVNFWENAKAPLWFLKLLDPVEFLFFGLFFAWLAQTARSHQTDADFIRPVRIWIIAMIVLLAIFTPLVYLMGKGFQTIYGAFYLISITVSIVIAIRMRKTIEAYK